MNTPPGASTARTTPPPAERRAMRPIFIGGCPRSGTTLLGALLGAHSRCVCVPEMPFKFDLLYGMEWDAPHRSWERVRRIVRHLGSFRMWGIPEEELSADGASREGPPEYRQVIESFVRRYARAAERPDADVWIEHIPHNIRHVHALLCEFPDAIVLHLVRDGRGVAASLLPVGWGAGTELSAAGYWADHLAYGFAAERTAGDRVHRVHYETVLRQPHDEIVRICGLAGLDPEPQLGHETRFPIPRDTLGQHALVARPPDPSRAGSWRTSLTRRQIETFEYRAGELLQALGYPLEFNGRARPPELRYRMQLEMRDLAWDVKRLGWKGLLEVKHRLKLGRPDAF